MNWLNWLMHPVVVPRIGVISFAILLADGIYHTVTGLIL